MIKESAVKPSINENLIKLAGYSKISATANLVTVPKYVPNTIRSTIEPKRNVAYVPSNTVYNTCIPENENTGPISEKKLFLPTYINKYRVVGCIDSGSDLTIMHASLYNKVKLPVHSLENSEIPFITTFSDNSIVVDGKFSCNLCLDRGQEGIPITIYVIPDIPNQTPFLLGNDLLRAGLGQIAYVDSPSGPYPEVTFRCQRGMSSLLRCLKQGAVGLQGPGGTLNTVYSAEEIPKGLRV